MPPNLPRRAAANLFICPRCKFRTRREQPNFIISSTQSLCRHSSSSVKPAGLRYTRLANRSLIRLAGPDAAKFLHDLLPAQIVGRPPDLSARPIYTVFLNAQGRILNDVFVYPPARAGEEDTWYIEVDNRGRDALMQHLKKHKLRSKFKLERLEDGSQGVWYLWPILGDPGAPRVLEGLSRHLGGQDPRPGMGTRCLAISEAEKDQMHALLDGGGMTAQNDEYTIHRMLNGIAEGSDEIIPTSALPMESNVEFCGGIDFHKGCYVGQELTIRTHHTGVIRKRILPCQLYHDQSQFRDQMGPEYDANATITRPPPLSNIVKSSSSGRGRSVGKWLNGVGNIGLALCRLEIMTGLQLTEEGSHYDPNEEFTISWAANEGSPQSNVKVKAFVPPWLSQGILAEVERRQRKSPKRPQEEEEEEQEEGQLFQ